MRAMLSAAFSRRASSESAVMHALLSVGVEPSRGIGQASQEGVTMRGREALVRLREMEQT